MSAGAGGTAAARSASPPESRHAAAGPSVDTSFFAAALVDGVARPRGIASYATGHRLPGGRNPRADGVYAEWHWDGATLRAATDRYGLHPLFVCARRDGVWLSPSIVTLICQGAPTDLDWDALSVFLRLGFFVGDDTPFAHIKALPPSATFEWRPGGSSLDGGFFVQRADDLGREAALDGYIDLFRRAIRRRVPEVEDVAVPLSGGRDSRHILLELCEQGRPPSFCVTAKHYPPFSNEDARVATLLTAALDLPHAIIEQGDRFDAERRKNALTSFCADEHAWTLTLADFLRGRATAVFDGIGGDVLSSGLFLTPERVALSEAGCIAELAEVLLPRRKEHFLAFFLRPEARARTTRERALKRIATEVERHAGAANPVGSFFFWNRTRREIALVPYAILRSVREVFAPYLDHDLFDFLASLPVRLLLDGRLHTDAIAKAYPRYCDVPFQNRDAPRPSVRALHRHLLRRLVAYDAARDQASSELVRESPLLLRGASLASRFLDLGRFVEPAQLLYLLQLERRIADPHRTELSGLA